MYTPIPLTRTALHAVFLWGLNLPLVLINIAVYSLKTNIGDMQNTF